MEDELEFDAFRLGLHMGLTLQLMFPEVERKDAWEQESLLSTVKALAVLNYDLDDKTDTAWGLIENKFLDNRIMPKEHLLPYACELVLEVLYFGSNRGMSGLSPEELGYCNVTHLGTILVATACLKTGAEENVVKDYKRIMEILRVTNYPVDERLKYATPFRVMVTMVGKEPKNKIPQIVIDRRLEAKLK